MLSYKIEYELGREGAAAIVTIRSNEHILASRSTLVLLTQQILDFRITRFVQMTDCWISLLTE